jgi:hypothetical protein
MVDLIVQSMEGSVKWTEENLMYIGMVQSKFSSIKLVHDSVEVKLEERWLIQSVSRW